MDSPIKPILLLADSQLLFWQSDGALWLQTIRDRIEADNPAAAYLGASNSDLVEFYHLFRGAMEGVGIAETRMIPSEPSKEDREFLARANLLLLAGGDPRRGWEIFEQTGLHKTILDRYARGALLVGVSAGAVQLGTRGWKAAPEGPLELFDSLRLVPYLVDVHDEPDWQRITRALPRVGGPVRGLGIPTGGGALVHPDLTVEPVRHPVTELKVAKGGAVKQALLFPPDPDDPQPEPEPPQVRRVDDYLTDLEEVN